MKKLVLVTALATLSVLPSACGAPSEQAQGTSSSAAVARGGLVPGLVTGRIYDDLAAHTEERMADFEALGVKALRIEIEHTTPLPTYAAIARAAEAHGIGVLAVVSQNSLAGSPDPMAGDLASFDATYVPAYVAAIDAATAALPTVRTIEVWNEPDNFGFVPMYRWAPGSCTRLEGATRYALLATRVFETLSERRKQGLPTPRVAAFGVSRADDVCLRSSLVDADPVASHRAYYRAPNGMPDGLPTDIVAIHGYGNAGAIPGEAGYTYEGTTFAEGVASFLDARFADGKPIVNGAPVWYTEVGFCRDRVGGPNAEEREATALTRAFATLKSHREIEAAFFYDYRDDEAPGTERCGLRASSTGGFAPHPAYAAYRAAAKR